MLVNKTLPQLFSKTSLLIEQELNVFLEQDSWDSELAHYYKYSILGGKCYRAALFLELIKFFRASESLPKYLVKAALSFEFVHASSLVHDDLPCMDDDSFRRNKPSMHVYAGEANAVMLGYSLLISAFENITSIKDMGAAQKNYYVQSLTRASGGRGMLLGQFYDLKKDTVERKKIHRLKTGALMASVCEMACYFASDEPHVSREAIDEAIDFGLNLGEYFQWKDDLDDGEFVEALEHKLRDLENKIQSYCEKSLPNFEWRSWLEVL